MDANPDKKKPLVIVYHADCIDGAASAWSIARAWDADENMPDHVTYIPYGHHNSEEAKDDIRKALKPDALLYFADVAPDPGFLDEILSPDGQSRPKIAAVHILDHHKSAHDMLKDYAPPAFPDLFCSPALNIHIDPAKHSAARMIWEHLMPDTPVPPVLDVIDKMDGDAAGLKTAKDFAAAALIDARPVDNIKKSLRGLRSLAKLSFNQMAEKGKYITATEKKRISRLVQNTQYVSMQILPDTKPVKVPVVNVNVQQYGRRISQKLVDMGKEAGSGVAFAWFVQSNGVVSMSIRTDGTPDAQQVAEHLKKTMGVTGGGHAGAGAVHFESLFEFARQMPFDYAKNGNDKDTDANPEKKPPPPPYTDHTGKFLH